LTLTNFLLALVFLIFLAAAFFFAFAESAVIAAERVMLHHLAREGNPRAKLVIAFHDNPRRFFGTTLIGTNICIVTLSAVGAHTMLPTWGVPIAVATAIVDIIVLTFAEITPKTLSLSNPTINGMRAAGLLELSAQLLTPFVWLITALPSRIVDINNIFHRAGGKLITESQLVHMIGVSAREGSIEQSEGERAVNVFKFGDTMVDEVMVPKTDMVHLTVGDTVRKAITIANATGYSRIPVLTEHENDSLGFIAVKDILTLLKEGHLDDPVEMHVRPIRFIPDSKRILELLDEFRKGGEQVALVIDEFGDLAGLVSLEDLLEEILGEIYDEYDRVAPDAQWVDETLVIPGSFPPDKLAAKLEIKLPDGDFDTSAGFFLHVFGEIPRPGERVKLDDKWELVATHLLGHRITKLSAHRITK
jgi:putative hemolysin